MDVSVILVYNNKIVVIDYDSKHIISDLIFIRDKYRFDNLFIESWWLIKQCSSYLDLDIIYTIRQMMINVKGLKNLIQLWENIKIVNDYEYTNTRYHEYIIPRATEYEQRSLCKFGNTENWNNLLIYCKTLKVMMKINYVYGVEYDILSQAYDDEYDNIDNIYEINFNTNQLLYNKQYISSITTLRET